MIDRSRTGIAQSEIAARTGWLDAEIKSAAQKLIATNRAKNVADPLLLVSAALYDDTRKKILTRVEQFHRANPLSPGITREDLRTGLGRLVRPETFRAALAELATAKKIDVHGENVKPPGAAIRLDTDEASTKSQIEATFAEAGLTVPAVKEVLAKCSSRSQTRRPNPPPSPARKNPPPHHARTRLPSRRARSSENPPRHV